MSFVFEDLNEELFEKVIAFSYRMGSGMGGPGDIFLLTRGGKRYVIGEDGFEGDWLCPATYFPFMAEAKGEEGEEKWFHVEWGMWKAIYIRKEYKERLEEVLKGGTKQFNKEYPCWWDYVWLALGIDPDSEEYFLYDKTKEIREREEEERKKAEEHFEAVRLKPDAYPWRELYCNNQVPLEGAMSTLEGYYLLLFRRHEEGRIDGAMMTITFQREQISAGSYTSDAKIEAYNLFYHYFEDIRGPLEIPPYQDGSLREELEKDYRGYLSCSSVNTRDRFIRSYESLEEAKHDAMFWIQVWGGINAENVIPYATKRDDIDEMRKKEKREAELAILFIERYADLIEVIKKYDFPGNAIWEVSELLGIDEKEIRFLYSLFDPMMFTTTRMNTIRKVMDENESRDN